MELFAPELMAGLRAIIKKEMEMQLSVHSSARELQETMDVLRSKLHGLRKEKIRDLDIRKWIDTLENIMYDADDVLDECHFRDLELRLLSTPPSPASSDASVPVWRDFPLILTYVTRPYQFYFRKFCSNRDMSVKLEALNSRLKMLKTQRDNKLDLHLLDNLQDIPPVTDPEAYTMPSVASCSDVVGVKFRQDAEFMMRLLTEHHGSGDLPLYAIVGPGGIGKTTMANLIVESLCDKKKQRFFDGVIRVTVPRKFDKLNLLKRIITAAGGQWAEGDLLLLDEAVKEAIKGKRLLLFLDDVCDAMGLWNLWLSVLFRSSCAPGSRVLITTRNRDAAEQMKAIYSHPVQRLTGDEGWELLCRCVASAPEAEQLKIAGLQIVEKCYGNPLAIMSMGGMLCLENKARVAWERILEDDDNLWSKGLLNLPDGIHKGIYFAFDNLPSAELRNCFVYCSLFPDAYEISCSDLIELWVAEGIVPDDEAALSCFMHLIRRNVLILQLSPEFSRTCKMDGLSCSLGRFIIQGGGLVITQTLPLHSLPCLPDINNKNKLRRLSLVINNGNVDKAKMMEFEYKIHEFLKKQPSLRTLLLFNHPLPRAGELLHHLPSLRLLSLRKAAIFELPESIGSLVHLRFLDLSGNEKMKKLPEDFLLEGRWHLPNWLVIEYPLLATAIKSIPIDMGEDWITWDSNKAPSSKDFKKVLFEYLPTINWYSCIWFKGGAINLSLYYWLAYLGGLKTTDILVRRGLGVNSNCCFCFGDIETHSHLFFECPFSMHLIRSILPYGNFFLMQSTLKQVLNSMDSHVHKIVRRIHYLSTAAIVYCVWRERNKRIMSHIASTNTVLIDQIKERIAFKVIRWKVKESWPEHVLRILANWKKIVPQGD